MHTTLTQLILAPMLRARTVRSNPLLRFLTLLFAVHVSLLGSSFAQAPRNLSGNWEGESICTVADSPCHNEHVIYRIAQDKNVPGGYTIGADKVVNEQQEYMGDLHCIYDQPKANLRCVKPGVWEFTVAGDAMTGTLKLDDGTLYRKISVKKK